MTKQDFKVGQEVAVYRTHPRTSGQSGQEERVFTGTVEKVGRKYIHVNFNYQTMMFDATNNFLEVTEYSPDYRLFPSMEDAEKFAWREAQILWIRQQSFSYLLDYLEDDEISAIVELLKKAIERSDATRH